MGGRARKGGGGDDGGMDMMSCLIGCLILILIGILLIIMVSQALIIVANPDAQQVQYIQLSKVDAIKEDKAFPKGNKEKEPIYLDVHRDHLVIFPGEVKVMMRDLDLPDSPFRQIVKEVKAVRDEEYFVLLIRPHAAEQARRLRRRLLEKELIQVGTELVRSGAKINYDENASETRKKKVAEREARAAFKAKEEGRDPADGTPQAPDATEKKTTPFPGADGGGS